MSAFRADPQWIGLSRVRSAAMRAVAPTLPWTSRRVTPARSLPVCRTSFYAEPPFLVQPDAKPASQACRRQRPYRAAVADTALRFTIPRALTLGTST